MTSTEERHTQEGRRRPCAYCGQGERLTREDLFATFLRAFYPSYRTYLDHRRHTEPHGVAPVVRDVCQVCNNELLSRLDGYMARLNRTYFSGTPVPNTPIDFKYKYHPLLRWLLKAWYNDARASRRNEEEHRAFTSYIIGQTPASPFALTLMLGILPPFTLTSEKKASEHPRVIRFGTTTLQNQEMAKELVLARMLSLNSYLFHLFVWRAGLARQRRREFARGIEQEWAFKELHLTNTEVRLELSRVDTASYLAASSSSGGVLRKRLRQV